MTTELRNRLIFGVLFAGLVVAAIAVGSVHGIPVGVVAMGLLGVGIGSREYVRLARSSAPDLRLAPVLIPNLLLVLLPVLGRLEGAPALLAAGEGAVVVLGLALGWALLDQIFRRGPEGVYAHVGATALGLAYLGIPFLLLVRLSELERGGALLLVFIAAVKCGDITAFFGGKAFGRHKLCPAISPGKTWEGFACSFIGAIGGSYVFAWLPTTWGGVGPFEAWWHAAVWGLVLGPLGVVGDLAESCMKRAAGAKDSGRAMPGFGGMLDVLDALIIAAPAAYLLARVL
jgi:phosphatidate cytidylyltransferase